jgi:hypothetical protein
VELLRLAPEGEVPPGPQGSAPEAVFPADHIPETGPRAVSMAGAPGDLSTPEYNGGIEGDEEEEVVQDGGLQVTLDKLAEVGRSGGGRSVFGDRQRLVESLDRTFPYTLVVVGDLFLSKGHAARQRAIRDLRGFLEDRIRAPIVTADEIGSQYLFGKRDVLRAGFFLLVTIALFFLVLTNQDLVMAFLANTGWYAEAAGRSGLGRFEWLPKLVVSAVLFLFIPVVAYSYGRVASTFLKLIKME